MKRLMREEVIRIPESVEVKLNDKIFEAIGPKGTVKKDFRHLNLTITLENNSIFVRLWNGNSREQSKLITCASLIKNALTGCSKGYRYVMKAAFKHFPIGMEVEENGKKIIIKNFLGEKRLRRFDVLGDSVARLGEEKDTLVIEGPSIDDVSQCAGNIMNSCKPKNFDRRIFMDGVYISKKGLIEE
ncbi:60S ribosomal protein L9-B [Astathelohania contejeani]|uniref:60S ribosomal protein L9-B n=1 Tax=Astathelohania contejeani TaxID=164912 RepID=A0ABQ7HVZ3_9MICR|nr:60S ribosomal protein L9-B [Thelohania contejeani]